MAWLEQRSGLYRVAFRHGIQSAFGDAWIPFAHSLLDNEAWQAVKAAGDEWKAFGIGIETHSASRNRLNHLVFARNDRRLIRQRQIIQKTGAEVWSA